MATTVIKIKRNILLVGRTGVGKSHIANHIIGNKYFEANRGVMAVTSKTQMAEAVLRLPTIKYNLQIIDTPGFFHDKLTNQEVIKDIKTFLKINVPEGVHLILFVLEYVRFMPDDRTTFSCASWRVSKARIYLT